MLNNNKNKLNSSNFNIDTNYLTSVVHSNFNLSATNNSLMAKGDSGAMNHYLCPNHAKFLKNVNPGMYGPLVLLPNNDVLQATTTGHLNLHSALSSRAQEAHIFPQLRTSLILLGQLTDDDCVIMLNKNYLNVFKIFKLLLTGTRNLRGGLWDIPLVPPTQRQFYHAAQLIHKSNVISIQHYLALLRLPLSVLSKMDIFSRGRGSRWPT